MFKPFVFLVVARLQSFCTCKTAKKQAKGGMETTRPSKPGPAAQYGSVEQEALVAWLDAYKENGNVVSGLQIALCLPSLHTLPGLPT